MFRRFAPLALSLALLLIPGAASAHTEIVGSQPSDGQMLRKPPDKVVLTFAEAPLTTGLAVVATGPAGRQPLDASVRGTEVIAPWPTELSGGDFRVAYRVVADDGHPVEGSITFSVAQPRTSTSATPTSPSTAAPATTPNVEDESPSGIPGWLWLVAGLLVLAAAWWLIARRSRPDEQ